MMPKFVTKYYLFDSLDLVHCTCTQKPTMYHQILPSLCMILKLIQARIDW